MSAKGGISKMITVRYNMPLAGSTGPGGSSPVGIDAPPPNPALGVTSSFRSLYYPYRSMDWGYSPLTRGYYGYALNTGMCVANQLACTDMCYTRHSEGSKKLRRCEKRCNRKYQRCMVTLTKRRL